MDPSTEPLALARAEALHWLGEARSLVEQARAGKCQVEEANAWLLKAEEMERDQIFSSASIYAQYAVSSATDALGEVRRYKDQIGELASKAKELGVSRRGLIKEVTGHLKAAKVALDMGELEEAREALAKADNLVRNAYSAEDYSAPGYVKARPGGGFATCPACGNLTEEGWSACQYCGTPLGGAGVPVPIGDRTQPAPGGRPGLIGSLAPSPRVRGDLTDASGRRADTEELLGGATTCPSCGEEADMGWASCPACGMNLRGEVPRQEPEAAEGMLQHLLQSHVVPADDALLEVHYEGDHERPRPQPDEQPLFANPSSDELVILDRNEVWYDQVAPPVLGEPLLPPPAIEGAAGPDQPTGGGFAFVDEEADAFSELGGLDAQVGRGSALLPGVQPGAARSAEASEDAPPAGQAWATSERAFGEPEVAPDLASQIAQPMAPLPPAAEVVGSVPQPPPVPTPTEAIPVVRADPPPITVIAQPSAESTEDRAASRAPTLSMSPTEYVPAEAPEPAEDDASFDFDSVIAAFDARPPEAPPRQTEEPAVVVQAPSAGVTAAVWVAPSIDEGDVPVVVPAPMAEPRPEQPARPAAGQEAEMSEAPTSVLPDGPVAEEDRWIIPPGGVVPDEPAASVVGVAVAQTDTTLPPADPVPRLPLVVTAAPALAAPQPVQVVVGEAAQGATGPSAAVPPSPAPSSPPPPAAGTCPGCGEEVEPDFRFCPSCDRPLQAARP